MKISVIVPVYKVKDQIARCLDSLVNQTYKDIEIICVGDKNADDDGTYTIVEEYTKAHDNLTMIYQPSRGPGAARNYGLEKAKSKYIMFIDSDDYIVYNMIEQLYNKIRVDNSDIVCCGFDRVDNITGKVYSKEMTSMKYNSLDVNLHSLNELAFISPSAWGKLYKRDLIKDLRFPEDRKSVEDLLFFLRLAPKIKKVSFLKQVLYHYTVRKDSLIFQASLEKGELFKKELLEVKSEYKAKKLAKQYLAFLDLIVFIHLGISMIHRMAANKDININKYIIDVKKFMNKHFPNWKKIKIRQTSNTTFKNLMIFVLKYFYRFNIFIIFIRIYNFMISKLKIDIKW